MRRRGSEDQRQMGLDLVRNTAVWAQADSPWGFIRGRSSVHISRVPKKFVFMVISALIRTGMESLTFRAEKQTNKPGLINISHSLKMLT